MSYAIGSTVGKCVAKEPDSLPPTSATNQSRVKKVNDGGGGGGRSVNGMFFLINIILFIVPVLFLIQYLLIRSNPPGSTAEKCVAKATDASPPTPTANAPKTTSGTVVAETAASSSATAKGEESERVKNAKQFQQKCLSFHNDSSVLWPMIVKGGKKLHEDVMGSSLNSFVAGLKEYATNAFAITTNDDDDDEEKDKLLSRLAIFVAQHYFYIGTFKGPEQAKTWLAHHSNEYIPSVFDKILEKYWNEFVQGMEIRAGMSKE